MKFWLVSNQDHKAHVIVNARSRESAKSKAFQYLGQNPDWYIVTPLTHEGEQVYLDVTIK